MIGALVTYRQTGTILYAVMAQADETHWRLRAKLTDRRGRTAYTGITAGAGDVTLVKPPLTYEPGETVNYGGKQLTVSRDLGAEVVKFGP